MSKRISNYDILVAVHNRPAVAWMYKFLDAADGQLTYTTEAHGDSWFVGIDVPPGSHDLVIKHLKKEAQKAGHTVEILLIGNRKKGE